MQYFYHSIARKSQGGYVVNLACLKRHVTIEKKFSTLAISTDWPNKPGVHLKRTNKMRDFIFLNIS